MREPPAYAADMRATEKRLFTPGAGTTPPALAGREQKQKALSLCLPDLIGGRAPLHDVALVTPPRQRQNSAAELVRAHLPQKRN